MTEGKIWIKMVKFAFPLFLGNLFQQLYSIVDSLVVGNVLGKEDLAAVTSSGSLIFMMVGFVQGLFMGASVIISRSIGAKDEKRVAAAVHTSLAFSLLAGIALMIVGVAFTPHMLKRMGTPVDVMPRSVLYFRVYFYGAVGAVVYNAATGVFNAIGDSRHPLYYLVTSSIMNVLLDILFVAVFQIGIAGAALATCVSQFVSAILCVRKLTKISGPARVSLKKIRIRPAELKQILVLGIPAGIQNSVIAIANVVVQSNINAFGSVAMAGCGTYSKLEGFAFLPITSFSMALTTFIGQNLGAKKFDRVKKGARFGIIAGISLAELIGIVLVIFAPTFVGFFNRDPQVIRYGVMQARTEALFFFLLALSHCFAGIFRGAGKTKIPMLVMLAYWCVVRIIYITCVTHFIPSIRVIFWAYPLTWSLSSITFIIYYFKGNWMHAFKDN
ncbi:MAG: MATE family efflux transporter [Lachnospiraceae bacterium]